MSHRSNILNLHYIIKSYNECNDFGKRPAFGINNNVSGYFPDCIFSFFHDHVYIAKYGVFKALKLYPLLFARKNIE